MCVPFRGIPPIRAPVSAAIVEYLCETYDPEGAVHPLPTADRAGAIDHRYWLHYSEGSLGERAPGKSQRSLAPLTECLTLLRPAPLVLLDLIMGKIETGTPWCVGRRVAPRVIL